MTLSIEFFFEKDKIIQADRAYDCVGLNVQEQLLSDALNTPSFSESHDEFSG